MFMLWNPSIETFSQQNLQQIDQLLKSQNLLLPNGFAFSNSIQELLTTYHNDFRLTANQARFLGQLITNLNDPSVDPQTLCQQSSGNRFELLIFDRVAQLNRHSHASCNTQNLTLTNFKTIADLLQIQIKLYTVFGGVLSCRIVGSKRKHSVKILATLDDLYSVIRKTHLGQKDPFSAQAVSCASENPSQGGTSDATGESFLRSAQGFGYVNTHLSVRPSDKGSAHGKRTCWLESKRFEESLRKAIQGTSLAGYEQLWSKESRVGKSQSVAEEYISC